MVAVPEVTPVIMPVVGVENTAVAIEGVELLQVPPPSASLSVIVAKPGHTVPGPVSDGGAGFTVATTVTEGPQPFE